MRRRKFIVYKHTKLKKMSRQSSTLNMSLGCGVESQRDHKMFLKFGHWLLNPELKNLNKTYENFPNRNNERNSFKSTFNLNIGLQDFGDHLIKQKKITVIWFSGSLATNVFIVPN